MFSQVRLPPLPPPPPARTAQQLFAPRLMFNRICSQRLLLSWRRTALRSSTCIGTLLMIDLWYMVTLTCSVIVGGVYRRYRAEARSPTGMPLRLVSTLGCRPQVASVFFPNNLTSCAPRDAVCEGHTRPGCNAAAGARTPPRARARPLPRTYGCITRSVARGADEPTRRCRGVQELAGRGQRGGGRRRDGDVR